jgi:N-acetylmuramoyl-L-alanine amidase
MAYITKQIALISMAFFLAIGSASADQTTVSGMILVQDEQSTRAYIDLSGQTGFKVFSLQNPERAVVDIESAVLGSRFHLPAANGSVLSVRQGKTPTGIRLVFDLASNNGLSSELVTEDGKTRLLIDLKGGKSLAARLPGQDESAPATAMLKPAAAAAMTLPAITGTAQASVSKPPERPNPGQAAVGHALADDEIVQIEIDSSGTAPKTTVKPATGKAQLPKAQQPLKPTPSAQVPLKKGKTVNDVLGASARKVVIAIDAGHGGKDPGAIGPSGIREKDITLRVARELADSINADPGMRAVLIRSDDQFVALQDRYMRARRAQADMFISIHADAAQNHAASGSSVYVLSTKGASSQAARWLADKENAADLVGGVSLDNKDGYLPAVLLDMSQSMTMRWSEDAAGNVLQSLKDLGKAHKKQVEFANFVVLRSPDVPSMLIETGFITNADEERKLNDPEHRKRLAQAISQGVRTFFVEQPLQGTYYARSGNIKPVGVNAAAGGVFP